MTMFKDLMRVYCKTVDIRKFGYFCNTKHSVTKFSIIPFDSAFQVNIYQINKTNLPNIFHDEEKKFL